MSTIKRVAGPNGGNLPEGEIDTVEDPAPAGETYFDQRVQRDVIDSTRAQARAATYTNSTVENQTIKAVDAALFERVRAMERFQVEQAEGWMDRNRERVGGVLTLSERIEAIQIRLDKGEDPEALAKEFKTLELEARRAKQVLTSHVAEARRMSGNLADPIAAAQKILSMMPRATWQPLRLDIR